ncbi:MAG: hypothetical protein ABIV06_09280 [Thermoanaerobaculia bacterium]
MTLLRPLLRPLLGLCLLFVPTRSPAQPAPTMLQQLAEAIGPAAARQAIAGLAARAEATGPRGPFVSEMLSLADGTARFRLTKDGDTTERLATGGKIWQRSHAAGSAAVGAAEPAEAAMIGFVRGHEIHRMLLDIERRFRADSRATATGCVALLGPDDLPATMCVAMGSALPATIELGLPAAMGGGSTTIELADWRRLHGVWLPYAVNFLHAGERHTYRYTAVLPFRLAPGAVLPAAPGELLARLDDLEALAAAHERGLEAHRRSDLRMLLDGASERSVESGRGVLRETGRDDLAARLGPYLAGIRFSRYEDVALPIVAVSADGTLGWLACQIEAAGTTRVAEESKQGPEAIAYGFSWVELYAMQGGRWQAIGNASSARP